MLVLSVFVACLESIAYLSAIKSGHCVPYGHCAPHSAAFRGFCSENFICNTNLGRKRGEISNGEGKENKNRLGRKRAKCRPPGLHAHQPPGFQNIARDYANNHAAQLPLLGSVPEGSQKNTASQDLIEMAAKVVKLTSSPENQTLSTSTMDSTDLHHLESQVSSNFSSEPENGPWPKFLTGKDTAIFFFLIVRNILWLVHFCLISYFFCIKYNLNTTLQ